MKRRNYSTATEARNELVSHGFVSAHARPGEPEVWARPKNLGGNRKRFVIGREQRQRCTRFHILPVE